MTGATVRLVLLVFNLVAVLSIAGGVAVVIYLLRCQLDRVEQMMADVEQMTLDIEHLTRKNRQRIVNLTALVLLLLPTPHGLTEERMFSLLSAGIDGEEELSPFEVLRTTPHE